MILKPYVAAISVASLLALAPIQGWAEYRISTVDMARILGESAEAKKAKETFDARASKVRDEMEGKKKSLMAREKKVKDSKSESEAESFRAAVKDYERELRDKDEELRKEFVKVNRGVTEKIVRAIEGYAKEKDISLVLDRGGVSRGPILFGDEKADITDEIIAKLNKG